MKNHLQAVVKAAAITKMKKQLADKASESESSESSDKKEVI